MSQCKTFTTILPCIIDWLYVYVYTYIYIYVYMCVHVSMYFCVCMCLFAYVCMYVCYVRVMFICIACTVYMCLMYVCIYVCMCVGKEVLCVWVSLGSEMQLLPLGWSEWTNTPTNLHAYIYLYIPIYTWSHIVWCMYMYVFAVFVVYVQYEHVWDEIDVMWSDVFIWLASLSLFLTLSHTYI